MTEEQPKQAPWWEPGLILFFKLSSWIAGPILAAVFVGKFLDRAFGTEPWIFVGLTGIAFLFSTGAIIILYTREVARIEKEEADKKLGTKNNQTHGK